MSKITNDGLTRSGPCFIALYPYGNSECQRVKPIVTTSTKTVAITSIATRHTAKNFVTAHKVVTTVYTSGKQEAQPSQTDRTFADTDYRVDFFLGGGAISVRCAYVSTVASISNSVT